MKSITSGYVYLYIIIVAVLFLVRVIIFAFSIGGIEMDSGWHLGVARNLDQRGIYASYTNTITNEKAGDSTSIHGRFSVQDKNGYIYFPAAISVGPGYVIPQALLLKIFGFGWPQFRSWPLISFFGLLILLFYFVYKFGGLLALIIFQIWLWLFPQIYISMSFEAYGEHIALFYLLLSFYLFLKESNSKRTNYLLMFLSGITFSFSILTKFIALFGIAAFVFVFVHDIYLGLRKENLNKIFLAWFFWIIGLLLPIGIFALYRYLNILSTFGAVGWEAVSKDMQLRFKSEGSGLVFKDLDTEFLIKKFLVWKNVGFKSVIFPWVILLLSPIFIYRKVFKKVNSIADIILLNSCLAGFLWFIFISPTGWARHAWISLVLGLVIVFIFIGRLFSIIINQKKYIIALLIGALFFSIIQTREVYPQFLLDQSVVNKWELERYRWGLQGLPTNSIFSITDQKLLTNFFDENIRSEDRVYFLDGFLYSEMSVINNKVFFPYGRYEKLRGENPSGGDSYLLIGPYQKGRLSLVDESYLNEKVNPKCSSTVYENPSYTLCILKKLI
ncbi:MAG: hypothetical protein US60_C0015G0038 [Microgenomates group bacterium GW2011_GWC1_37_8]|uniref:Glycosyltransferase RgtA/B/C/D-like domain-containing protein n=1 Tax=Candidatus Woesebacteria bacterium GW2011_GWB1_38_8 TaxID=1618570 RepID=A0A0G0L273_9BACT|nr:MAG: hypothetical protein US60_C0015G0038 [Microgenomates group bacterium GW2011_GWC1_37_8]KKQ86078.1 MAG: hypothetical protein UT08_C0002G0100 [Candidatus Woesebacteria bacterium GW2011_GWB1_38_8]